MEPVQGQQPQSQASPQQVTPSSGLQLVSPVPDQSQQLLVQALAQAVAPLQGAILSLQQQLEQQRQNQAAQASDAGKAKLAEQADLRKLLSELDEEPLEEDRLAKLSPKQLLDVMGTAVETAMQANNQMLRDELGKAPKATDEKIDKLGQAVMALLAKGQVDAARSQFTDFDNLSPAVQAVINKYPGIDMQDAYLLAKGQEAVKVSAKPAVVVATERPTSVASSQPVQQAPMTMEDAYAIMAARGREAAGAPVRPGGVVNFRGIVDSALDKVLAGHG